MAPILGLYSLSGKTSYRKISWSLEAARFGFKLFQSLWNLAGTSAALLPRCLSNFRAIRPLQHTISRLRDFTRFGGKTSYRLAWIEALKLVTFASFQLESPCFAASILVDTKMRLRIMRSQPYAIIILSVSFSVTFLCNGGIESVIHHYICMLPTECQPS